ENWLDSLVLKYQQRFRSGNENRPTYLYWPMNVKSFARQRLIELRMDDESDAN
ncbi:MAG: hypothetical protein JWN70_4556, partial [Planctomycetaceae bacterium]|nr:hypothetical protein [Planctomycetaceae bacterium]